MSYDNETSDDQNKICNMFASFFKSVYCEDNNTLPFYSELCHLDYINSIDQGYPNFSYLRATFYSRATWQSTMYGQKNLLFVIIIVPKNFFVIIPFYSNLL